SRRRHTRFSRDWSSDVCSSDLDLATGRVEYMSQRPGTPARLASQFAYEPQGPAWTAEPGTLEFFLVERYVLFTQNRRGELMSGQIGRASCRARGKVEEVAGAET